jgi:dihydroflavonol-4-reductase
MVNSRHRYQQSQLLDTTGPPTAQARLFLNASTEDHTSQAVCVTGATGFIGAQVATRLARRGQQVRVTFRDRGRLAALAGADVTPVEADVLGRSSMRQALDGCDVLFHTAGLVASRPRGEVWRVNAVAPRIAVECAAAAGVRRVVLTSSVAAIGPAPSGRPADEKDPFPVRGVGMIYADSKREGERAAFVAGERLGIEVVSVNPAYVLGVPANRAPGETSTRIVGNYLRGRLPAIVDAYTNIVDVEDVADGHLLAAESGKPGERYILGGENLRWSDVMQRVAELAGRREPLVVIPPEVAAGARMLGRVRVPGVPLEGIRLMAPDWRYSSAKAQRELGYAPRAARETLERTVDWYLELIESGRLDHGGRSSFGLMTAGVRLGDRLRLLVPLKAAGRVAGRKTVL